MWHRHSEKSLCQSQDMANCENPAEETKNI